MPNILVRDFTNTQKKAVDAAADAAGKSTSRFCRDAAVLKAGGKLEDGNGSKKAKAASNGSQKKRRP